MAILPDTNSLSVLVGMGNFTLVPTTTRKMDDNLLAGEENHSIFPFIRWWKNR